MRSRSTRLGALVVTAAMLLGACGSDDPPATSPTTSPGTSAAPATSGGGATSAPTTNRPATTLAPTTTAAKLPVEKPKITIATAATAAALMTTYVAEEQGFFKAEGLDVTVTPFGGGAAALTAVATDAAQMCVCGFTTPLGLYKSPTPAVVFYESMSVPSTVVYAAKDVKTWKDVVDRGGSVGVLSIGGADQQQIMYMASKEGVDPSKIKFVAGGSAAQRVAGLRSGAMMAIGATLVSGLQLKEEGFTLLGELSKYIDRSPLEIYTALGDFVTKNPGTIQAVIRAEEAARKWIIANPQKTAELTAARLKVPDAERKYHDASIPLYIDALKFTGFSKVAMEQAIQFAMDNDQYPALRGETVANVLKTLVPTIT